MANDELVFERKGYRPTSVQGLGGGNVAIGFEPNDPLNRIARVLQTITAQEQEKEKRRQEKLKAQYDMYNTLRNSGYDPKAAHNAVMNSKFPSQPGGTTLKEEKESVSLAREKQALQTSQREESEAQRTQAARLEEAKAKAEGEKIKNEKARRELEKINQLSASDRADALKKLVDSTDSGIRKAAQQELAKTLGITEEDIKKAKGAGLFGTLLKAFTKKTEEMATEKVLMVRPDGQLVKIKPEDVSKAQAKGYQKANG